MCEIESLTYSVADSESVVIFESKVVSTLWSHRQDGGKGPEAGGQIFAEFNGSTIRVVHASVPGGNDRRWWSRFIPDRLREQREIYQQYQAGLHFVGDWHTHPQEMPSPSHTDVESLQDCFRKSKHQLNALLMVIIGFGALPDAIGVWRIDDNICNPLALVPFSATRRRP